LPELKEFGNSGIRIKGDGRTPGSSDFVESELTQVNEDLKEKIDSPQLGQFLIMLLRMMAEYYHGPALSC
jgi:hypothetical protein